MSRKPLPEFLSRALKGRSQAQLARDLGISRSTVHLWVKGKNKIPERYRDSLRAAARGRTIPTPPPRTTRFDHPPRPVGTAKITPLPGGNEQVYTDSRNAFARELARLSSTGNAPNSFTVVLHAFRGAGSDVISPTRNRRIQVRGLTDREIRDLASGRKDALEAVITRTVKATNYTGGFTFTRATKFNFDSTP